MFNASEQPLVKITSFSESGDSTVVNFRDNAARASLKPVIQKYRVNKRH